MGYNYVLHKVYLNRTQGFNTATLSILFATNSYLTIWGHGFLGK